MQINLIWLSFILNIFLLKHSGRRAEATQSATRYAAACFDFEIHDTPGTPYGPLKVILVVLEPQIQQLMMYFLLEVDGMRQIPRNVAVIEICQDVHNTHAMHFVISHRTLWKVDSP